LRGGDAETWPSKLGDMKRVWTNMGGVRDTLHEKKERKSTIHKNNGSADSREQMHRHSSSPSGASSLYIRRVPGREKTDSEVSDGFKNRARSGKREIRSVFRRYRHGD